MDAYRKYKEELKEQGKNVPENVSKFPVGMKSFKRKLRYERSQSLDFSSEHPSAHDLRVTRFYKRLERMGHPNPEQVIAKFYG